MSKIANLNCMLAVPCRGFLAICDRPPMVGLTCPKLSRGAIKKGLSQLFVRVEAARNLEGITICLALRLREKVSQLFDHIADVDSLLLKFVE